MATNGKKGLELSRSALIIGLFSLLAVGSWVGFDIYRAIVKSTLPEVLQTQIQPLETKVDENLINDLRNRRRVDDATLNSVRSVAAVEAESTASATATITITPTPAATTSGEIQL